MKKFGKFLFSTLSVAAAVGGIYCLYKNHVNKAADLDDFDDADDDFEEDTDTEPENREYVSINITTETVPDDASAGSAASETSAATESADAPETSAALGTDDASAAFQTEVSGSRETEA